MPVFHQQPARAIEAFGSFDVIVCGGGPTGFVAAIAAARGGAKTLLIERYGFFGGTATAAMMIEFGSMFDGERPLLGGITHEFLHRLQDFGGVLMRGRPESHAMTFDPESMIHVCQTMVEEAGVHILLHTWIADAICDQGRVAGVVVENKSGRQAVFGKVVIDCTGDGDVAARAGAGYSLGRPGDGMMQPVSIEILLANVDATRVDYDHHAVLIPRIAAARKAGTWTIPTDQLFSWGPVCKHGMAFDPRHAHYFINGTNCLNCNGTDARSLTEGELGARRQIGQMLAFLRENAPGFENAHVDRVAAQIGIRETRRITGDYTLTRADVLAARHFDDGVVPGRNSIDVHEVSGKAFAHEFLQPKTHYQIPYRCFLPRGLEGLLVAGRCLSADHHALGSVRVMIVTMPMGDAVGTAAAMAAERGLSPRTVPTPELRATLRARGTVLEDPR